MQNLPAAGGREIKEVVAATRLGEPPSRSRERQFHNFAFLFLIFELFCLSTIKLGCSQQGSTLISDSYGTPVYELCKYFAHEESKCD
jgi:hypothetical protein